MEECEVHEKYVGNHFYLVSLLIKDCGFVIVYQLKSVSKYQEFYYFSFMLAVNILDNSYFSHVACKGIKLWYLKWNML